MASNNNNEAQGEIGVMANSALAAAENLVEIITRFEGTANATPNEVHGVASSDDFTAGLRAAMAALLNVQQRLLLTAYAWGEQWASGPGELNAITMLARWQGQREVVMEITS